MNLEQFIKACNDGDYETVSKCLNRKGFFSRLFSSQIDINGTYELCKTALHYSAAAGYFEIVKLLISNGADINAADVSGETALHYSAAGGHFEIVKLLISNGADINAVSDIGDSVLYSAASNGHLEIVKLLIANGADINAGINSGKTALNIGIYKQKFDMVKYLVANGADINASDQSGDTALKLAASHGNTEAVKLLIDNGAAVNAATDIGATALYGAVVGGHTEIAKMLIEQGADVNCHLSETGTTALHSAASKGHIDIAKLLISNGADIQASDYDGETVRAYAAENGHSEIIELLDQPATWAEPGKTDRPADLGKNILVDSKSGLMWQREDDGIERSYRDANSYCENLSLDGFDGWRLPTIGELATIFNSASATKHASAFINAKAERYWSITEFDHPGSASPVAYTLDFSNGSKTTYFQENEYFVRAVRNS